MNIRQLATLAFLITGIYALINSVFLLQSLLSFPFYQDEMIGNPVGVTVVWTFSLLVLTSCGIFLVVRRRALADALFPSAQTSDDPPGATQIEDLALSVLGLYFVVSAVPNLASAASGLINLRAMDTLPEVVASIRSNVVYYLGTLAQLVIGAYMCLKGHAVGRFLRKLRSPKIKAPDPPTLLPQCPTCGSPFDPSDYRPGAVHPRCSKCHEPLPGVFFQSV